MSAAKVTVTAALAMLCAAVLAWWLTPTIEPYVGGTLTRVVPTEFGDWKQIQTDVAQVNPTVSQDAPRDMNNPYDEVLMRAYANSHGDVVFVALAYGQNQRQEVKIHRPDLCYVAQGFKLLGKSSTVFPGQSNSASPINGQRMLVQSTNRTEAVSYWIRIGNIYSKSAWSTRRYIFVNGLQGHALDGVLVRVSQVVNDSTAASERLYARQEEFAAELVAAMEPTYRHMLLVDSGA